ncbi:hypothetical protein AAE02nite_43450 [Adhaeribacter aerolatus]|uniref:Uncharacterized protein n=1 Tax=Adhaeribacter aerolatus TaxID=670289 RepID=A0A512B3Z9_9BACT|nr:SH3 domain-containing protein [Adhaeribacter aerolatus]GEO06681.1 hypothetical protein AAE02nite_43450 [Adhaeribacter aerolatus]
MNLDNIEDLINSLNKQNKSLTSLLSGNMAQNLTKISSLHSPVKVNPLMATSLSNLAKSFSQPSIADSVIKAIASTNYIANIAKTTNTLSNKELSNMVAIQGLSSSLHKIINNNPNLNTTLSSVFQTQLSLSQSLNNIIKNSPKDLFNQNKAISVAIQGISSSYLNSLIKNEQWSEMEEFENTTESIVNATAHLPQDEAVSVVDYLSNLRDGIAQSLTIQYHKVKSPKVRQFIIDLMSTIGFLLAIYTFANPEKQLTQEDFRLAIRQELSIKEEDINKLVEYRVSQLYSQRIAKTNVNLRFSNKKNSSRIGLVLKGQIVFVIEVRGKWILISYLDSQSKKPMSGFVYKKYFTVNQ